MTLMVSLELKRDATVYNLNTIMFDKMLSSLIAGWWINPNDDPGFKLFILVG